MNFVIYPLIFGIVFSILKSLDLWFSKNVTKTYSDDWRFNPHLIWILFLAGMVIGLFYVMLFK